MLIVIEGLDGAGKRTLTEGLRAALQADGKSVTTLAFPRYGASVHADLAVLGEVGLSGELRSVGQLARRLHEASKLGFTRALTPRSMAQRGGDALPSGIEVIGVRTLYEALDVALAK